MNVVYTKRSTRACFHEHSLLTLKNEERQPVDNCEYGLTHKVNKDYPYVKNDRGRVREEAPRRIGFPL